MKQLKRFFQWLQCKLRGGHVYSDKNLMTTRNERDMTYIFKNRCLRCGKEHKVELPMENIITWGEFKTLPESIKNFYRKAMIGKRNG